MAASTNLTPEQRRQRARIAALAKAAKYPGSESTAAARSAWMAKYGQTDADLRLTMAQLAFRSSKARAK